MDSENNAAHERTDSDSAASPRERKNADQIERPIDQAPSDGDADIAARAPKKCMTRAEKIQIGFNAILVIIGGFGAWIYYGQREAARIDQRAWIAVGTGKIDYRPEPAPDGIIQKRLMVPILVVNTGKTPARNVTSEQVMVIVRNGQSPSPDFSSPFKVIMDAPVVIPNFPQHTAAVNAEILSESDLQRLIIGKDFITIYVNVSYTDIFGKTHFLHWCSWTTGIGTQGPVTSEDCVKYNDMDKEKE